MRILVVEDEKEIADGITLILKKAGYQVDYLDNGEDGVDGILSGIYDLILLDVMLPKKNGFEILKQVREDGINTPIIMLTAKSQIGDKIEGLNLGADDYMTKPFDGGELLARINARVRNKAEVKNGQIDAFDISLDAMTFKLCKDKKSVKLTKTEYNLLEYLMLNRGQILTKDMIISKIWGNDDETEYNNIEVYISFLRKKLKYVEADSRIVTKKGVGYSLTNGEEL